jgi:hypothetical protein
MLLAFGMRSTPPQSIGAQRRARRRAVVVLALLAGCCLEPCYSLVVVSATLPPIDPSGGGCSTWDCAGSSSSNPDPYVRTTAASLDIDRPQTRELYDTLEPRWDEEVADDLTVTDLTRPIAFDAYDADHGFVKGADDHFAHFELTLTPEQIRPGPIVLTVPVVGGVATLTLELR